jgi:hypothetical protein
MHEVYKVMPINQTNSPYFLVILYGIKHKKRMHGIFGERCKMTNLLLDNAVCSRHLYAYPNITTLALLPHHKTTIAEW